MARQAVSSVIEPLCEWARELGIFTAYVLSVTCWGLRDGGSLGLPRRWLSALDLALAGDAYGLPVHAHETGDCSRKEVTQ